MRPLQDPDREKPPDASLPLAKQARAWWVQDDVTDEYVGARESWALLADKIAEDGPFDGVIGFSQGTLHRACLLTYEVVALRAYWPQY